MTDLDIEGIGRRIGFYRRLNGWSAARLADESGSGLTRDTIANIENGRREDIGVKAIGAIASALRVPLVALLFPLTESADQPSYELAQTLTWMQGWPLLSATPEMPASQQAGVEAVGAWQKIAATIRGVLALKGVADEEFVLAEKQRHEDDLVLAMQLLGRIGGPSRRDG